MALISTVQAPHADSLFRYLATSPSYLLSPAFCVSPLISSSRACFVFASEHLYQLRYPPSPASDRLIVGALIHPSAVIHRLPSVNK